MRQLNEYDSHKCSKSKKVVHVGDRWMDGTEKLLEVIMIERVI